ncbi:hypothetical protein [Variovorax boronicumulans]|uniref:hypothetical protein n=1 Tax=Variovorax boronicumulans TaxID=436515 RepID=UPI001C56C167
MATSLSLAAVAIELPDDLIWVDELAWSPIRQKKGYSIEGALIVDRFVLQAGRPITLIGNERRSWVARGKLLALQAWASLPTDPVFTLRLHGIDRQVIFDLGEAANTTEGAVRGEPVFPFADPEDEDAYCSVELRFMEI